MASEYATTSGPGKFLPASEFEDLVGRYQPRLYRIALKQVGNPDDAQDALQEALLLAFRHRDQFQGRSQWATWITRIVINAARGQQRRRRARPASSLEEVTAAGVQFRDHRPSPEAGCLERERHERLRKLMRRLSPALREAVEVRELQGLSCRQAAQRLGIPAATLKCRTFRARARLQELSGNA
ncbi:MAG TPA: sigma-70 family RNA polymerase sigma factor [Terriglobales bacterium]|nr:sigma-70 family RNA polymerase sigma factor [Terriglobales bacterium]